MKKLCILLLIVVLSACNEEIIHDLSEVEANRVITVLDGHGITAKKDQQADGHWAISVGSGEAISALSFLDDRRILRENSTQRAQNPSVISSREDQRFWFERSLSHELEKTLLTLNGVLEARVHLNLPAQDPLFHSPLGGAKGSASILLLAIRNTQIDKSEIAKLVIGASGVSSDAVSVMVAFSDAPLSNLEEGNHSMGSDVKRNGWLLLTSRFAVEGWSALAIVLLGTCFLVIRNKQKRVDLVNKLDKKFTESKSNLKAEAQSFV